MTVDPYVDPRTGVLINKLGIADADQLQQAVADVSAARLGQLAIRPLAGLYDLVHLRQFHKRIFGDVFAWAGQIRSVQIFKETGFCLPQHIESYAADEFAKLAKDDYLKNLPLHQFVQKLAYYHAEINEMHPFREGNGRAQRAFLRQLASDAGYQLDWNLIDAEENTSAAVAAHQGDLEPLTRLLAVIVKSAGAHH
ncbi:MAG TPA: cell filamentation protein Fic [Micromonosporaceae bacterium]|nr:cell filamentation protein Fic [Micromonosporaceae bacterium]HCU52711.1 cell filamentation protein Fic [Micromonosporaceae bacterium]